MGEKSRAAKAENKSQELRAELDTAAGAYSKMEADATQTIQGLRADMEKQPAEAEAKINELQTIINNGQLMLNQLQHDLNMAEKAKQAAESSLQESNAQNQQQVMQLNSELENLRGELSNRPSVEIDSEELEILQAKLAQQERMIDNALRLQTRAEIKCEHSVKQVKQEAQEKRNVEAMLKTLMGRLNEIPELEIRK